jgi:uncharacterized protein
MTTTDRSTAAVLGLLIGAGLAAGGWFVGHGLFAARATERYVTVKGLAERQVAANLVVWPIVFGATGDDLSQLQAEMDREAAKVRSFLADQGFAADEVGVSTPRITDFNAQGGAQPSGARDRYSAEVTMTLRSSDLDGVERAMQLSGELVKAGVALRQSYEYQTEYFFTDLESVKPEMIAEATRDARRAAEQFAHDSGSRVGAIRNATQGYFSVEPRDRFSPEHKTIRVVTTVQFFLEE